MPGAGLTSIGIAGVAISYSGIAHTFVDGMHSLTGLTMFIGLIFLAAGIMDGGISTSKRAKITTLVVISIGLGFGAYALTMSSSNYTITLIGLLLAIAVPSIIISYLAMKSPQHTKKVGTIAIVASIAIVIVWFGVLSPDTQMVNRPVVEKVEPVVAHVSTAPVFQITILEKSDVEGNPDYEPDVAKVTKGYNVQWINDDAAPHTVTSSVDFGDTFNSNLMNAGEKYTLDTSTLEAGSYEYMCMVHPWMIASIEIQ